MDGFSKFLQQSILLSYPNGGKGHAFLRILYAHEEFFYWNVLFNPWYIYDSDCKKPLDWIETQEHTDITYNKKVYTPVHLDHRPLYETGSIRAWTREALKSYIYKGADKRVITDFIRSGKKIILANHATTNHLLENFPINTIINLYSNKEESIKNDRGWPPTPFALSQKYYWAPHDHPNILNISKERIFSKNFDEFEKEYKKLISYFNLKKTYTNKVRTFILRHTERCEYYRDIEVDITNTFRKLAHEKG